MNWGPQQERALDSAGRWLQGSGDQVYRIFGFAGTGKTTLAQHLAQGAPGQVLFAAYTGKAASVMRSRGCTGASTIHQVIYKPAGKSTKRLLELEESLSELLTEHRHDDHVEELPKVKQLRALIRSEKESVVKPSFVINPDSALHSAALIVIDECSMVDERMGQDLLSFGKKILVLGDPAQLPPVRGEGFFTANKPDVMLTEIHRQAQDNPIIQLATQVRQGQILSPGMYGESCIMARRDFNKSLAQGADQVLVGRNATRKDFNQNFRHHLMGIQTALPCKNDKLVCLRNNHELGILNGQIWRVLETSVPEGDSISLSLYDETDLKSQIDLTAHTKIFLGQEIEWWARKEAEEFDYGYALTVHKAQGSQWKKVLIFDESSSFRDSQRQWLYTAITRASEQVTILQ